MNTSRVPKTSPAEPARAAERASNEARPDLPLPRHVERRNEAELEKAIQASASRILGLAMAYDSLDPDPETA